MQKEGIHTAIETCGYGSWEAVREAMLYTDLVLYDLKVMDSKLHKEFKEWTTGRFLKTVSALEGVCIRQWLSASRWFRL